MIGFTGSRAQLTAPISGEDILASGEGMNGPAMRVYHPSVSDRAGNAVYDALSALGIRSTAHQARENLMPLAGFVPILGDAIALEEAAQDYQAGDYGSALAGLGLTAVGSVPVVGDAVAAAGRKGLQTLRHAVPSEAPTQAGMLSDEAVGFIKSYGVDLAEAIGIISSETAKKLRDQGMSDQ